jgi:hypothetical protein
MGKIAHGRGGTRGSPVKTRQSVRGKKEGPWDPMNPEEDPLRDLRARDEDPEDVANDEYIWPEYTDEDED